MNEIVVKGSDIIILAILVLAVGNVITQKISLLRKFSIPIAVTGGLLCSIAVALIATFGGPKIVFDLIIRDTLLMVFFTTIGISAKFSRLAAGGKSLGLLVLCAAIFLVVQDATGDLAGVFLILHPVERNTSSNSSTYFVSWSRCRSSQVRPSSWRCIWKLRAC
ncbi:sodium/glutamate symporter [Stieleria sp. ICT_E10.1]|uniref:sodium/glutamate symporter n=1 Tax=Stieleria sedimenti TaxID=2976331 RepID=UPI00217F65E6|nr:sodium/glutamate symporter [Stieleria sedimenti]MCS7471332.1 sodium/glutamate symporter [Stieleria sedimenti]